MDFLLVKEMDLSFLLVIIDLSFLLVKEKDLSFLLVKEKEWHRVFKSKK